MVSLINKNNIKLPRGFTDKTVDDLRIQDQIITTVRDIYELYGFDHMETPLVEYADVLGKFLPDQDRPNSGVFSLKDEDGQWLSLRYDLTAPLARYVAENFEYLPKPFRSYRAGWVFRNEKPGPGRYRQFLQFDADTVGTESIAADAEMCIMVTKILAKLGIRQQDYLIRVNNRKILDGVMEKIHIAGENQQMLRLSVLRAIDKFDKFPIQEIALLLGNGRLDESGDFTKGAGLDASAIDQILRFVCSIGSDSTTTFTNLRKAVDGSTYGLAGVAELEEMYTLFSSANCEQCIKIDPSVVRGLEYYTGPVFEVTLLFDVVNDDGQKVVFGSIGGGGRYDSLISNFRSDSIPATGFSIGISRLVTAMRTFDNFCKKKQKGPVVVLVMDRSSEAIANYQRIVENLHKFRIRAEVYAGISSIKAQMKYADRRNAPCVIIQGDLERKAGTVSIKDLDEGYRLSSQITDNRQWRKQRPAQITVHESQIVETVERIITMQSKYS